MLISIVCLVPVWPLLSSMAVLYHVNYKLRRPHCSFSFPLHYIDQFLPWRFLLFVYFRLWSSTKKECQLREPLANKTTGKRWSYPTWKVIPEPGSADRQVGGEPSPHVTAVFPGVSVRFEASPILKDWNWVIRPDEAVESRAPLESDPSLIQWWRLFFN